MTHQEYAASLREDQRCHYNCCQSTLTPFAVECGVDAKTACSLGAHFGAGMRRGGVCGAVTGGLMALGLMGADEAAARGFLRRFGEEAGNLDCAQLLKHNQELGGDKKCHCDGLIGLAIRLVEDTARD
ncbi:MAG: GCAxxG family protein [Oscillospiraceae bacterium]|nr:GCAxxG family protein [Oscillospiraceae bacterium]